MSEKNNNNPSILGELKRRRLFRSMAAYVVGAWILVQIADVILPIYDAPEWIMVALVTLLLLGFTPAMIFAWLYNITTHGLEASGAAPPQARILSSRRFQLAIAGATTVLTGLAVWWVWTDYVYDLRTHKTSDNPVVVVTPVRNLSSNAELDWLGEGLANLVRTNLAQSRHAVVVSNSRWESITRGIDSPDEEINAAKEAGIEYAFSGEFISTPGGLYLSVRVTDLLNGVEKAAKSYDGLTPESMLGRAYVMSTLARQALVIPRVENVDSFAADFVVNNMTAYEAYVGGLGYFRRFQYEEAEQAMSTALLLADDFHIARYRLAQIYMSTGRQSEALETVRAIPEDAMFTQRERFYVEAASAFFKLDLDEAIASINELLELYPYEVEARQFLAELYFQNYQDNAAVTELQELAKQEPENEFIWGSLGTFLILSGRLDEAEEPLRTYYELALEKAHPLTMLGDLYRQRGDFSSASEQYKMALDANPDFAEARRGQAQVLAILGESEKAKNIWRQIVADQTIPADERIYAAFDFSSVLRSEGRFRESLQPLVTLEAEIHEERIREAMALSMRAMSHMELGEFERADALLALALERNLSDTPTRVLLARGLLELQRKDFAGARNTAAEIRTYASPGDDAEWTVDRAASFLEGLVLAANGNAEKAVAKMQTIFDSEGYDYVIYELGMAKALFESGEFDDAANFAKRAMNYRDASEIRLDLDLERVRAGLLKAQIHESQGEREKASALALAFVGKWVDADQPNAELDLARRLASK